MQKKKRFHLSSIFFITNQFSKWYRVAIFWVPPINVITTYVLFLARLLQKQQHILVSKSLTLHVKNHLEQLDSFLYVVSLIYLLATQIVMHMDDTFAKIIIDDTGWLQSNGNNSENIHILPIFVEPKCIFHYSTVCFQFS